MLGSAHRDCKGMHPTQPSHAILRHTRMIRTRCSEEVIKMIMRRMRTEHRLYLPPVISGIVMSLLIRS